MECELREQQAGIAVMTCRGGLSWEAREQLPARIDDYLRQSSTLRGVVVDLSAVEFVNSAGLGGLFQVAQHLREKGARLALADVPPTIQRLLETVGMVRVTIIAETVPAAIEQLTQDAEASGAAPASEGE